MIIGNKNNNNNKVVLPNNQTNHYKDIMNTKEMNYQSYQLLEQRYKDGLISLEEFRRKCNQLQKRQK